MLHLPRKPHLLLDRGVLLLFIAVMLLSPAVTYYLTDHFLQGDMSSDLLYANHLYETGQLIAGDWYGSTELRILRAEWIFMPLFALFEDWHMVRYVGTMIMQLLIVRSFLGLMRQIHAPKSSFFLGASLLLLPYNFAYGVNVLYGCFYATFLSIIFFSVGLVLSLFYEKTPKQIALRCAALSLLGFVSSLGGPRILLNAAAPLFLTLALMLVKTRLAHRHLHAPAAGACLFLFASLAGYIINSKVLYSLYRFQDYPRRLQFNLFEQMDRMLTAILHTFGFQSGPQVFSKVGILALCGVMIAALYLLYLALSVRRYAARQAIREDRTEAARDCVRLLSFFVLLTMVAFKVLTNDLNSNETYYLLVTVWFVPCLAMEFADRSALLKRCAALLIGLVLCANGAYSLGSLAMPDRFPQYSGETFQYIQLSDQLDGSCAYLLEEGYDFGYSTFWPASVVTEKTDGRIELANISINPQEPNPLERRYWLTTEEAMTRIAERAFMLFSREEEAFMLTKNDVMRGLKRIYEDEFFCIYDVLDPANVYSGLIR